MSALCHRGFIHCVVHPRRMFAEDCVLPAGVGARRGTKLWASSSGRCGRPPANGRAVESASSDAALGRRSTASATVEVVVPRGPAGHGRQVEAPAYQERVLSPRLRSRLLCLGREPDELSAQGSRGSSTATTLQGCRPRLSHDASALSGSGRRCRYRARWCG